jgi:hypothetical protein
MALDCVPWSDVDVESPWHVSRHALQNSAASAWPLRRAKGESYMTGRCKIIDDAPGIVKIGGVVSIGPTSWWSLSMKEASSGPLAALL